MAISPLPSTWEPVALCLLCHVLSLSRTLKWWRTGIRMYPLPFRQVLTWGYSMDWRRLLAYQLQLYRSLLTTDVLTALKIRCLIPLGRFCSSLFYKWESQTQKKATCQSCSAGKRWKWIWTQLPALSQLQASSVVSNPLPHQHWVTQPPLLHCRSGQQHLLTSGPDAFFVFSLRLSKS